MSSNLQTSVEFVVKVETFDDLATLDHSVTYFIPSTVNVSQVDLEAQAKMVEYISTTLATEFGGATKNAPAAGLWPSQTDGMVEEGIIPVTVFTSDFSPETQSRLIGLGREIMNRMSQETVMLVVDGKAKFL